MITYLDLARHFPTGTFDAPTDEQLLFNFALLEPSQPTDSMVRGLAQFLDGLYLCNQRINSERAQKNPPLPPIDFCLKTYTGTPENPNIQYALVFPVDVKSFVEIVIDPTE
jgi:hypothetical protein